MAVAKIGSKAAKRAPAKAAKKPAAKAKRSGAASDAVDEQLARYRAMRDFKVTAEPAGSGAAEKSSQPGSKLPFCVQKHAASHLHYDFRLGWNGVLKSWAVAKGPSYVVADKRLAVQVEDHPMEYGGFEGIIPAGQYGGGTVMLWDQGTWEPQPAYPDVAAGLRDGSLKFILHGTKLKGKWALIRMGGKSAGSASKPNWLLIKEHDPFERPVSAPAITDEEPDSVVTGRDLDAIARSQDHVWNSKETAKPGQAWYRQEGKSPAAPGDRVGHSSTVPPLKGGRVSANSAAFKLSIDLRTLPAESQPAFIPPQLAQAAESPPASGGWLHELKLDGYRIQARKEGGRVQLLTRTGLDWTARMAGLAAEIAGLPVAGATLDGEVVVLAPDGNTSFASLQAAFQEGARHPLTYFAFDLLHLNGRNLRNLPLGERKALLAEVLPADPHLLRVSEHLESDGPTIFRKACELHAEGIVSKRAAAKYCSGRSSDWLKSKCLHQQEFVVGGFTLPSNGIYGVGALLLGYYRQDDGKNRLIYAGRTGTGFTSATHKLLRDRLEALAQPATPFAKPPAPADARGARWVKPTLVAEVRFATWTADALVRQAAFLGLREDKPAAEVVREDAAPTPKKRSGGHHSGAPGSTDLSSTLGIQASGLGLQASSAKRQPQASHAVHPRALAAKLAEAHPPIRLTHPAKILDPETGLTKQALADYYLAIAPRMLPHIAGRPLSLVRCPEGAAKPCFFQKHVNATLPKGIGTVEVPDKKTGELEPYITLPDSGSDDRSNPESLASLAQLGVLEIHPWGSRNEDLEHPDRLVFDLDPDEALPWQVVSAAAAEVRAHLKKLSLASFLKTTGGKGLHVVVPIAPTLAWPVAKAFAHAFALALEKANPALYLTKMTKAARTGRIYLDYLRNERGATAVAPYSPRARAGCPVSMPLAWAELDAPARPIFRVADFASWRGRLAKDPWKALASTHQRITPETLAALGIQP